jgi:hypothetical protein
MDAASDRRSKLRIVVGPEITIAFRVKQTDYQGIRITNLSASGCFATVPRTGTNAFRQGTLLDMFIFEHPDLEGDPMTAKVAYVLGGGTGGRGGMDLIGLGIHFESMTPSTGEMLMQFVEARS